MRAIHIVPNQWRARIATGIGQHARIVVWDTQARNVQRRIVCEPDVEARYVERQASVGRRVRRRVRQNKAIQPIFIDPGAPRCVINFQIHRDSGICLRGRTSNGCLHGDGFCGRSRNSYRSRISSRLATGNYLPGGQTAGNAPYESCQ